MKKIIFVVQKGEYTMNENFDTMDTMNMEEEVIVLEPAYEEAYEEDEKSGLGSLLVKGALGLGAAGIGAAGALAFKNKEKIKNKITNRQIKKLTKKGFVVYQDNMEEYVPDVDFDQDDEDDTK